jgi:hypothetical protein
MVSVFNKIKIIAKTMLWTMYSTLSELYQKFQPAIQERVNRESVLNKVT